MKTSAWNYFLEFPHQPHDSADNPKLSLSHCDRSVLFILRFERDDTVFFIKTLQGRFTFNQGADDLTIVRRPLLLHDHTVAVQDTDVDHAVSFDLQGKQFSRPHIVGDGQKPFDVFFAEKRLAGGDSAHDRDVTNRWQNRLADGGYNLDGPLADSADITFLFQRLEVIGNAIGRGDLKLFT